MSYRIYNWENWSSDGFADAIESRINLYNRERIASLEDWIDSEIEVLWSLQDSSIQERGYQYRNGGIIEGWHGDGNFDRTSLMYCLMKTMGQTITPWREDVVVGFHCKDDILYITLRSEEDWEGTLHFGRQRHKTLLNLPLDYPRINQFPEWYYLQADMEYRIRGLRARSSTINGGQVLGKGLSISLKKNIPLFIKITPEEHVK